MSRYFIYTLIFIFCACTPDYLPKPKGYNRIELPPFAYQQTPDSLPYAFEYSQHAKLLDDTTWISERYWVDIYYPEMEANIQITYKPVLSLDSLLKGYYSDAYKLTFQHNVKAYAIDEKIIELPNGNFASVTDLEGEVPTQFQFHISDSVDHFLRGALYFETATQNDSLQPVIDYIKTDILHMLQSLEWN